MIKSFISYLLIFGLAVSASAQGNEKEMYSWTDEEGVVHFSDQKPMGQPVSVHKIPDSGSSTGTNSSNLPRGEGKAVNQADTTEEISLAQQRREEMAKRREEILAAREKNEKECAEKRTEVEQLEPHRRVFFTNEDGEVERMDDVVRTDRVAEAKAFISANCQ